MEAKDLYIISDGDKGSEVASGLDSNFKKLLAEINDIDLKGPEKYATKEELETKVNKVDGKGLSENDFTDALLSQLTSAAANLSKNATFAGIATPTTNPEGVDDNVFYIATQAGTYSNFGGAVIDNGITVLLKETGIWAKKEILNTGQVKDESTEILNRDLGAYSTAISLPLLIEKSGKYVDPDGQEKSNSSMGISAPVEIKSGNIYLLQCTKAVGTGVAIFSRKVTNTYDKVIEYIYTYDDEGRIVKATAAHDGALVYLYLYDYEGNVTIMDKDGTPVPELPATRNVTESFYEPLFRTNDSTMPESGYYLLLCTQDMEVVISAGTSDITDKNLLGVRYGIFASIATNFVGSPGQKVIAQAFAELYAQAKALASVVDNSGHLKVDALDIANLPKVCGEEMYLTGEGAPSAPPTVPFQEYYDSENSKFYKAKGVLPDSPTTGDWIAIN